MEATIQEGVKVRHVATGETGTVTSIGNFEPFGAIRVQWDHDDGRPGRFGYCEHGEVRKL